METKYESKTLTIHAEISEISSYTVNYVNGGSKTFGKFENIDKYEKTIDLDGVIDVGEIDDGKYENGDFCHSVDKKKFLEDYPSYLTTNNGWYALPLDYVEELLKPILEEILTFFKNNMPQVVKKLSSDNVLNHLDEFKRLDKIDLETLSKTYKTCYCCQLEGTPTFKEPVNTEKCISKMSVPYGTIMGSRKYLEYNGELYLWFGEDKVCSLWC